MLKSITKIAIGQLVPHPHNPRRKVDVDADFLQSIKENGVRYNLAVIPADPPEYRKMVKSKRKYTGKYLILAGHRRHAAALECGLADLPCSIYDHLTLVQQIGMMIEENYQRKTLTLAEEISAMQLMLEHGDDIRGIATKTGISERTVSRRIRIAKKIGVDAVEKSERMAGARINLDDYDKLCEIGDEGLRGDVLEKIGTYEFDAVHAAALRQERRNASKEKIENTLGETAQKIQPNEEIENAQPVVKLYRYDSQDLAAAQEAAQKAASSAKVFYKEDTDGAIHVFASESSLSKSISAADAAAALEKQAREEILFRLENAFRQAYELRISYVKRLTVTPEIRKTVEKAAILALLTAEEPPGDYVARNILDIKQGKEIGSWRGFCEKIIEKNSFSRDALLLRSVYARIEPGAEMYTNADGEYLPCIELENAYAFLEKIGYHTSDEERQLLDGTHPLFAAETIETGEAA